MKKKLAFIAALLAAAQLFACGSEGTAENTSDPVSTTTTEAGGETRLSTLPENLNFDKTEVKILYWLGQGECAYEQTGDIVDDALYNRNIAVEDRLGVKITDIERAFTWDTRAEYIDVIRQSVMAGDDSFDIVSGHYYVMPMLIPDGVLLPLNETKYINFENPWWVHGLVEETAIGGKVYLASGEISISNIKELSCFFYNKRLVEEYSIEDPYKLVDSGEWTLDKLIKLTSDIYSDLDNDGKKSINDLYGCYFYNDNAIYPMLTGAGIQLTTLNKDGYPELTFGTEKMIEVMDKLSDFIQNAEGSLLPGYVSGFGTGGAGGIDIKNAFANGLGVFTTGLVRDAANIYNAMKDDFGVLPTPKYDENQEKYLTLLNENCTPFGITATAKNLDAVSAAMEALCEENHYTVSPVYFETALKVKYSRDDESAKMFDLIRESATYDFGRLYGGAAGVSLSIDIKGAVKNDTSWASTYASKKDAAKAAIDSFIESVKSLG